MRISFLGSIKLWQFNLGTFLVTQILFGVEGWAGWMISAGIAWATTRHQPLGSKDYRIPMAIWLFFVIGLLFYR